MRDYCKHCIYHPPSLQNGVGVVEVLIFKSKVCNKKNANFLEKHLKDFLRGSMFLFINSVKNPTHFNLSLRFHATYPRLFFLSPLNANLIKWSNTFKQFIGNS